MRTGLLVMLAVVGSTTNGPCLPILRHQHEAIPGETLGISVDASAVDRTIPEGTPVTITWSAANLTGEPPTVSITLESRVNLARTVLAEGLTFEGTGSGVQALAWNTEGFGGPYSVIANVEAANLLREDTSRGLVTVDARPKLELTAPTGDVVFHPATDPPLRIAWTGGDESATVRIGLDPDTDHASGNEVFILERELPKKASADSFDWNGTDTSGAAVAAGVYNLFATATDNVNPVVTVDGLGQVTVAN
jgi:hypothetical protein